MAKIFEKEMKEIARIILGLRRHLEEKDPALDKQLPIAESIFADFSKKYPKLTIKTEHKIDHIPIHIFINEQSVRKVFDEYCTKIKGLAGIGIRSFDEATLQEADKFAAIVDKIKDSVFLTYVMDFGAETVILMHNEKENKVELIYDLRSLPNKLAPQFMLLDKYASKEQGQNIELLTRCYTLGFMDIEDEALFEWEDQNYPRSILG